MSAVIQRALSEREAKHLETCIIEEWKVIQLKLDKIGEFKFNIKNWSMTLTIAYLGGIIAAKASGWCAFAAILFPIIFWVVEERQKLIQGFLVERIIVLEYSFAKLNAEYKTQDQLDYQKATFASGLPLGLGGAIIKSSSLKKYRLLSRYEEWFYGCEGAIAVFAAITLLYNPATKTQGIGYANAAVGENRRVLEALKTLENEFVTTSKASEELARVHATNIISQLNSQCSALEASNEGMQKDLLDEEAESLNMLKQWRESQVQGENVVRVNESTATEERPALDAIVSELHAITIDLHRLNEAESGREAGVSSHPKGHSLPMSK